MAYSHVNSPLFALLVSISLLVASSSADVWPTNGVCGARIRYSWDALTANDKLLYRDAISTAMSTGYHALFTEVHSDLNSFKEAHNTCGMMFWHRRFLLGYEEMLRSLGTRFACITIPYWDYFAEYAKFLANSCTSLEDCSTFLKDMGGSSGPAMTLTINGFTVVGNCVDGSASQYANFTNFCERSSMNGSAGAGCIPRGSWSAVNYPSGFCYSALAKYLSLSYGYAWFSQNIHYGVHQSIHNMAMGAMASYPTSADPIFYNHHATVDLIHQLYFNCQIGRVLDDTEKQTGSYAYQSCAAAGYANVPPTSTSTFTMYWNAVGQTRIPVESHPKLGKFFSYLPNQYWRYVSATDMGNLSYSYSSDDLFALLLGQGLTCPKNNYRRLFDINYVNIPVTADKKRKAVGRSYNLYQDILDAALANTSTQREAIEQGETLDCLWYDQNFGVDDFSPRFRANWNIPSTSHTLCYTRVQDVKYGRRQVRVSDWKSKYQFHYFLMTDNELAVASDITSSAESAMIDSSTTNPGTVMASTMSTSTTSATTPTTMSTSTTSATVPTTTSTSISSAGPGASTTSTSTTSATTPTTTSTSTTSVSSGSSTSTTMPVPSPDTSTSTATSPATVGPATV